jgi:hypothetical protein
MAMSDAAEMAAMRQRFGKLAPPAAAYQAFTILATNAYLLYLLVQGEASPTGFAIYGVLELIAWSVIANLALIPVPKELRVGSPDVPLGTRIGVVIVFAGFFGGIAWLSVPDREHIEQLLQNRNPLAGLSDLHILWPLLASIAFAASGSIGDLLRWRRVGGPFVTGTAMAASSKFLTAIVAPVVAAVMSGAGEAAHKALLWTIIYLVLKSAFELLILGWQFLGMPERQPDKPQNGRAGGRRRDKA